MTEKTTPRKPAERRAFKTLSIWLPAEAAPAARAVARHGRDIQNSATFLLRTAFDSHAWDKAAGASALKPLGLRPQGSAEAVEAFNGLIPALNAERREKRGEAHSPLEGLNGKTINLARTLLDLTLFERAVKAWPDGLAADKAPAFGRLPFKLARGFATASREGFSTWLKSVAAWGKGEGKGKAGGAGRPAPPGYVPKGKLPAIELADFGLTLPSLVGKELFVDEAKTIPLTEAEKRAWSAIRLEELIEEALQGRWGSPGQSPPHWPVRPTRESVKSLRIRVEGARARLLIMVEVPMSPPPGSFHAELAACCPEEWAKHWGAKKRKGFDAWMGRLASEQDWIKGPGSVMRSKSVLGSTQTDSGWISRDFSACGIDLGVRNVAVAAWSDGSKGWVLSGREMDLRLHKMDLAIDALIAKGVTQEHRDLQSRRSLAQEEGKPFPNADRARLRELSRALHQSPKVLDLRGKRARLVRSLAHQAAAALARGIAGRGVAIAVVGRNIGWKSGSDMGAGQNRRFHRIPHGLIIALLREKLDAVGVSLIETEESWTSAASFADAEPLARPAKAKGNAKTKTKTKTPKKKKEPKEKSGKAAKAAAAQAPLVFIRGAGQGNADIKKDENLENLKETAVETHSARRGEGRERDWLFRRGPWPRPHGENGFDRPKVHADLNGAYNMLRKACPAFAFRRGLSLKHEVWAAGKRRGFQPLPLLAREAALR